MELIGVYTVHKNELTSNENSYPVHRHCSHEILMLIKGNCRMLISDAEYALLPGDTVLVFENEVHALLTDGGPVEFLAAQFIPRVCEEAHLDTLLDDISKTYGKNTGAAFTFKENVLPAVSANMRRICDERAETDVNMYFTYIRSVLYELAHNATLKKGVDLSKNSAYEEIVQLYNSVTDYIGANLDNISDLSFIEREFHYSNSYINKLFRRFLGIPVWKYITLKRLDLAYNLLSDGASAKSASGRSGFSDYSVFYKSFVKHFGYSPSALRRHLTGAEQDVRLNE